MKVEIPLKTISLTNSRLHWRALSLFHRKQKMVIRLTLQPLLLKENIQLPCHITLTRLSQKKLDDDNLPSAFKAIRDEIANLLIPGLPPGKADDSPLISWAYEQKKGPMAIEIDICPTKHSSTSMTLTMK